MSTWAVAASTVRFSPSTEPKALQRVARHGRFQGFGQRGRLGRAAGIIVLDDHRRRVVEVADHGQGAVKVEEIVVGKFLAVELPGGDHTGVCSPRPPVYPSGEGPGVRPAA